MNNAPNIRIEVTEGAQIPDPRDRRLLNAWTLAFCVAVVALVTLCATQPEPYLEIVKFLPDGLIITFEVTALSLLCTLPIGLLTGLGRLSRNSVINLIASTYVEIIRGVPLLVQLFYIYYALGRIIQVPPMVSAVMDAPTTLEIVPTAPAELPAAMVQMLPGDPVRKRYKNGDWVGVQRWALYLRVAVRDTEQRVGAVEVLQEATDRIEDAVPDLPAGCEFRGTAADGTPTMRDAAEDYETWQVTFSTEFKRTRERR